MMPEFLHFSENLRLLLLKTAVLQMFSVRKKNRTRSYLDIAEIIIVVINADGKY